MAEQLVFSLPVKPALGREDFFVSPANAAAVAALERDWPGARLLLIGPAGSGKTHLAHVWAGETGARVLSAADIAAALADELAATPGPRVIEDVDRIAGQGAAEEALFHLLNAQQRHGAPLLLTCTLPPGRACFGLPDLTSRLLGMESVSLEAPDDSLLAALMIKLFRDRQIDIAPEVLNYLLPRAGRSFAALRDLVARLDEAALSERRAISRPFARRVLDNMDDPADDA